MTVTQMQSAVESVVFASGESVSIQRLVDVFETNKDTMQKIMLNIRDKYEKDDSGIELVNLDGNYQFVTKIKNADFVKKALDIKRNVPLSQASLEVLSVIAYNQPVTKSFIEQVRGVDSSGVVTTLIEKGLIEEAARLELPGRPISYKTTDNFLRCFSLTDLGDLPPLPKDEIMAIDANVSQDEEKSNENQIFDDIIMDIKVNKNFE